MGSKISHSCPGYKVMTLHLHLPEAGAEVLRGESMAEMVTAVFSHGAQQ